MHHKKPQKRTTESTVPEKYGKDREKNLSAEEVNLLAERLQAGDTEALEKLVKAKQWLVVFIVNHEYKGMGLGREDLISEGNIGLLKAARTFVPEKGGFTAYAGKLIRQSIMQAIMKYGSLIRLPVRLQYDCYKIRKITRRLEKEMGSEPTDEEIAGEANMPVEKVTMLLQAAVSVSSLDVDVEVEEEGEAALYDMIENKEALNPEDELIAQQHREEILSAVDALPYREAEIIRCYFGLGDSKRALSPDEIAERMDLSAERVKQLKEKAIRELRRCSGNGCKSYMEKAA